MASAVEMAGTLRMLLHQQLCRLTITGRSPSPRVCVFSFPRTAFDFKSWSHQCPANTAYHLDYLRFPAPRAFLYRSATRGCSKPRALPANVTSWGALARHLRGCYWCNTSNAQRCQTSSRRLACNPCALCVQSAGLLVVLIAGVSPLQVKVPFNFLFVITVHHFAS